MATPPALDKASSPEPSKPSRLWLWGTLTGLLVIGGGVGGYFWNQYQAGEAVLAQSRDDRKEVGYTTALFDSPVRVKFQRGKARIHEIYGPKPWRGLAGEYATCPDDSEGRDFAEFYLTDDAAAFMAQPFADETHPEVSERTERLFEVKPKDLWANAVVIEQSEWDGWKLRTVVLPTPHGGAVTPSELSDAVATQLAAQSAPNAPVKDRAIPDPRTSGTSYAGQRYVVRRDPQAEAERKVEEAYRKAKSRYDDRNHHYYVTEAVKDLGQGRIVVLRRMGQVFGAETVTRAVETVRVMAESVRTE